MHLLAATPGSIDNGKAPVDPGQTPADLVFISAADTELAALSQARAEMDNPPSLRLTNLTHLQHPMSVDLHLDNCATRSRLVVARILGGAGYWKYGFEQYAARLAETGVAFAALPGDDKPDADLRALSTVSAQDYDALWSYMVEGGPENSSNFLSYCQWMLAGHPQNDAPEAAKPLLRAGVYWPGAGVADLNVAQSDWTNGAPVVPVIFYRALVQGAGLNPINRLVKALLRQGLNPLPVFVASLKDPVSVATLETLFTAAPPSVILNATAFAVGSPHTGDTSAQNPLTMPAAADAPVFQIVLAGSTEENWAQGLTGLSARDIAMNVALPEVDGRVLARAISFKDEAYFDDATECPIATYRAQGDRIDFTAQLAANWARLRHKAASDRKVALVLANYPNKDGRLANGVGLDTPAATVHLLTHMAEQGYRVVNPPEDSEALMQTILAGPTNGLMARTDRRGGVDLSLADYQIDYGQLPWELREAVETRWGAPESDPFFTPGEVDCGRFTLAVHQFGNVVVGIQPARGYNIDPTETYHSPDLVPPHNYLAFYFWLRHQFRADAIAHIGKHGNLEWLPGKALALSQTCWPEAVFGPTPHLYPFIVNDPGEGTQAKRRAQAVILDHLTPPLTRAETYGPLRDLEALVDEYYEAAGVDPRRIAHLRREILSLTAATGLDQDVGMQGDDEDTDLAKLDAYLCELKEAQIRDGLHIFGQSPTGVQERDLTIALTRVPRGDGTGADASLIRALAQDQALGFDPLDCDMSAAWTGPKPPALQDLTPDPWRSNGDTVERLELFAIRAVENEATPAGPASRAVLAHITDTVRPIVTRCGPAETAGFLTALDGRFVAPGSSGAPTRGRLDVLPTGRNFFSVDSRAVPTPTAWALGWKSANLLIEKHLQTHGDWPRTLLLTAWGTANMRTGGDDIAQALALMGVKPKWDSANRRVTGFDILPAGVLGRPRVDVTLRISGFFRDAFPQLIALVDSAARAVMALDEAEDQNPAAARARAGEGQARVFGSKPGAYGAGLQALIDERIWNDKSDLAEAYLNWGSYAYGAGAEGNHDRAGFEQRLTQTDAIVQNQDNREHDLLDSDDYYQFEGGAAAAVTTLQGQDRPIYHNDHSRPERPVIRTLDEEIGRVLRSRVVNPKWINGVKRHGYKGAFEIAATVDYLFAFAATTGAVKNHHFDLVHAAFVEDDDTRDFIASHNAPALREIAERLQEAIDRGMWVPKSNSARAGLDNLLTV
ncbi:Aerobic cobaltochelatase subunit CobN [Thalassovita gelatinovora]|uniref:Cobaltochelatase subunit CobN n=1 Tax=Thalassovita gelatinovora TaxID=53501 RepID=A0A0P1FDF6_THAGE|nr:cobaltochelatase subunit CobN [Thalassovita gelatinovora]QIZ81420.1 cobaltochelatase subunit CobN [Thalassovita gelatinovora]CUH66205.1 Aerobic cobaltochelatase subunit CobN [Thalassovita gelatinovora]SEQ21829.1 cobaltochelatase CobN subunit [Thalassovita gelatinovora]